MYKHGQESDETMYLCPLLVLSDNGNENIAGDTTEVSQVLEKFIEGECVFVTNHHLNCPTLPPDRCFW